MRAQALRVGRRLEGAAVRDDEVLSAVAVEVGEGGPPADALQRDLAQPDHVGGVHEPNGRPAVGWRPKVDEQGVVQRVLLGNPVRDEQIIVAVVVPVARCETHRAPVVCDERGVADVLEAFAGVVVEDVVRHVVGDVQVEPAVVVEVVPKGAQTAPGRVRHPDLRRPR